MKKIILSIISFYQKLNKFIKTKLTFLFPSASKYGISSCRFSPTCSDYTYQAIERYGIFKGILLGVKRILRCHPWTKGGFDPIP